MDAELTLKDIYVHLRGHDVKDEFLGSIILVCNTSGHFIKLNEKREFSCDTLVDNNGDLRPCLCERISLKPSFSDITSAVSLHRVLWRLSEVPPSPEPTIRKPLWDWVHIE
jgi:hypothetical protein